MCSMRWSKHTLDRSFPVSRTDVAVVCGPAASQSVSHTYGTTRMLTAVTNNRRRIVFVSQRSCRGLQVQGISSSSSNSSNSSCSSSSTLLIVVASHLLSVGINTQIDKVLIFGMFYVALAPVGFSNRVSSSKKWPASMKRSVDASPT